MVIAHNMNERLKRRGIWKRDFHLIEYNGGNYLFHTPTLMFFEIDDLAYERLKYGSRKLGRRALNKLEEKYGRKSVLEVEKELLSLSCSKRSLGSIDSRDQIETISLNVAQTCNLRCSYCYAKDGTFGSEKKLMDEKTAFKAVDFFTPKARKGKLHIRFFGGEPLLNFKLIEKIVEYIKKKKEKASFRYSVVTNGTLFDKRIVRFLKDNKFWVTVSIDGPSKLHNRNRVYGDGRGSFLDIEKGLRLIKDCGGIERLGCRVTVADRNLDFVKMFRWLIGKGFNKVHFTPKTVIGGKGCGTDWRMMKNGMEKLFEYAGRMIRRGETDLDRYGNFSYLLDRLDGEDVTHYSCGAGRSYAGVDVRGTFYLCHRFTNRADFVLGDVEHGIKKISKTAGVDKNLVCSYCFAKYLCGGSCYFDNYLTNGDITRPNQSFCEYNKDLIYWIMMLYIEVKKRKMLKKESK